MPDLKLPDTRLVVVAGRLGRDAELRYLQDGTAVCSLSLAVDLYRGKDRPKDTLWLDVKCWDKTAERVGELAKGEPILVEGSLDMEKWTDRQTGVERTKVVVRANRVQRMSWPDGEREPSGNGGARRETARTQSHPEPVDDDIPF
jgi:single-strand DNA-binding protein